MSKLEIVNDGPYQAHIFIDGVEEHEIVSYVLKHDAGMNPVLSMIQHLHTHSINLEGVDVHRAVLCPGCMKEQVGEKGGTDE